MILALILFIATYVLLLTLPTKRPYIACGSALLFLLFGILPWSKLFSTIDWNVIMMIGGTMASVSLFIHSKMPALMADILIEHTPNVKWAVVALSVFAGIVSAFVDNVATVLMVAPVAITIAKKLNISPVNSIIAISISSNLQGAATLVGDTTSILLGGYANLDFMDFFFYQGKPSLFFIVELGALFATLILLYIFRKDTEKVSATERTVVTDYFPSFILVGTIISLIAASFIANKPALTNGIICVSFALVGIVKEMIQHNNITALTRTIQEVDFETLFLLAGLFVVVGGITEAGIVDMIAQMIVSVSGDHLFLTYTIIVWASVAFSAFIDNIPYVATMLPVVTGIASLMQVDPTVLYFGLLIGATLGGNITPVGASANITSMGILRKEGHLVSSSQFMKISVPFTLVAVFSGYVLTWLLFA